MRRVVVIGLGLIGGSIVLALRRRDARVRIDAIDVGKIVEHPDARALADRIVDSADRAAVRQTLEGADLAIFAAPVRVIESGIAEALELCRLVTDCGSTKRAIVACAAASPHRDRFVGGHPMAGAPEGGLQQARADLFDGKRWILCSDNAAPDAVAVVETLVGELGACPIRMTAAEHDHAVARTSHVPQLLASALLILAEQSGALRAAGPAFSSATRVAGGAETMWRDIFATNGDEIAAALHELTRRLSAPAAGLAEQPADVVPALDLLAQARKARGDG
jgi:prephenate dehydrogenase